MSRITLAIFAALALGTNAFARFPTEGQYESVGGNEDVKMMTDSLGMWGPKGGKERGLALLWMRWDPLTPAGKTQLAGVGGAKPAEKTRGLATMYVRMQIDCKLQRHVVMSLMGHNAAGEILFVDGDDNLKWSDRPKNPNSVTREVVKRACAAPFVAFPGADSDFWALTRAGQLTRRPAPISTQPSVPIAQRQPMPVARRCVNPATGLPMNDSSGSCSGMDSGGSRYGQNDRSAQFLPGVPGFDPHAR